MSWSQYHRISEGLAAEAEVAHRDRRFQDALSLYQKAAAAEEEALKVLDPSKLRTMGITTISAVSLWYKGRAHQRAEQLAYSILGQHQLPAFAVVELRSTLQAIWDEETKKKAGVAFLPGQVLVAVDGGVVLPGGAPLDLVVDKVKAVQSLFYRVIEYTKNLPHRVHGGPSQDIVDACRPWLFQAPAGSYQFSVAVQEPEQKDFFGAHVEPEQIASQFLEILKASTEEEGERLKDIVPDKQYRATFLKLSRSLAPTGKTFSKLKVKAAGDTESVVLVPETRTIINTSIRAEAPTPKKPDEIEKTLQGTLRAVHLDKDWLEVVTDKETVHIEGLKDTIDDMIGPMVNRQVIVRAMQTTGGKFKFLDIEAEE